jgi:hypothetical protein
MIVDSYTISVDVTGRWLPPHPPAWFVKQQWTGPALAEILIRAGRSCRVACGILTAFD